MPGRARTGGVRVGSYLFFFGCFAAALLLGHAPLFDLPYYWDEAGQFIPAALDIFREGLWIPRSTPPNIHPPAVPAYLAAWWTAAGCTPAVTRFAMLLLAAAGLLAAFLLAIELSREARGKPALLAAAFLAVSPLFFAQSMLAQLDAPAMLFTALALLWFLQERMALAAAACLALALVKETGLVVPFVFACRLAYERRWRDMAWFAAPAVAIGAWLLALRMETGNWAGNAEFARYNLLYPLAPLRIAISFTRRLFFVFAADFRWVGTAAMLYAWRRSRLFRDRSWSIAWLVVAAHIVFFSLFGGATLDRYLLPALPIVYAAMAASLSELPRVPKVAYSGALLAGLVISIPVNPPYPFPYENNLAFADFTRVHQRAAAYLERFYPDATVRTAWPLTLELSRPELGFVRRRMAVEILPDLSAGTLQSIDWNAVEAVVTYSRTWNPEWSLMRQPQLRNLWIRSYGAVEDDGLAEARIPLPLAIRFEQRGQWAAIYVNPRVTPRRSVERVRTAAAKAR